MKRPHDTEHGSQEARGQAFPGGAGGAAASDTGQGSFLERVSVLSAAAAILIALMGLVGYLPTLRMLGGLREAYIPMALRTALAFVMWGVA